MTEEENTETISFRFGEYRPYFLALRVEQLRKFADAGKTTDVLATMTQLMRAIDCWHFSDDFAEMDGFVKTVETFCSFVRRKCECHDIGHLPPLPVTYLLSEWLLADQSTPALLGEPAWKVDELYLFGWLACFALHEDFRPVTAWVDFDTHQGVFFIRKMRIK